MREIYPTDQPSIASNSTRGVRLLRNLLVGLLIFGTVAPVWAQRYKTIPVMKKRDAQKLERDLRAVIQNPSGFGAASDDVKKYFTKYYFPIMTSIDAENLGELGDRREDLFKRYLRKTANAGSQAELTKLCLTIARVLAIDNYHPAVRYNATLIIGNLDSRYAPGGNDPTLPVPLPEATALLLDFLEKDTVERKEKQFSVHPVVKTGALVGLERHARYGVDERYADRLTKAMLAVIKQEDRPEEISADVHQWMKGQAVAVLVQQFKASPNAQLQDTLNELITGDTFDLDDRCYVTKLMDLPSYEQAQDINAVNTLKALAKISQDVLEAEAKKAKEFEDALLEGNQGFSTRPGSRLGFGGGRGGTDGDALEFERRRLLSRLRAIQEGGDSVAEAMPAEIKSKVGALIDAMKDLRIATADDKSTDLKVVELVVTTKADVDRLVESWGGGEEAAEPAEADFS